MASFTNKVPKALPGIDGRSRTVLYGLTKVKRLCPESQARSPCVFFAFPLTPTMTKPLAAHLPVSPGNHVVLQSSTCVVVNQKDSVLVVPSLVGCTRTLIHIRFLNKLVCHGWR